jgi:proline iminopeptidase
MVVPQPPARERYVTRGAARLYVREVGRGAPIIVVHGGPDLDHEYLLPEMDRLAGWFHLIYYDQRGRGRSFSGLPPEDVNLTGEIDDLDAIRASFGFETVALLGHSWGALLAMEYATHRPHRVSHLVLMNTAPASHAGALAFREDLQRQRSAEQIERMAALRSDPRYQAGDIATDLEWYRIHFAPTLLRPDQLERITARLRSAYTSEGIVTARAIEDRLYAQTWDDDDYDLIARLRRLRVPTLLIHGDHDFVPFEVVREVADAIRGSHVVVLSDCGHFAYLEQPDRVRAAVADVMAEKVPRPGGAATDDSRR